MDHSATNFAGKVGRLIVVAASVGFVALGLQAQGANRFADPLDSAAPLVDPRRSPVDKNPLIAITHAGNRLVAVGSRGLIALSDDSGKTWRQAPAPVSSDLVAVSFPTQQQGWATGHDGVVLHSSDGGNTWTKQLDGIGFAKLMIDHFTLGKSADDATAQRYLGEMQRNFKNGPEQPFLSVWFDNENDGFASSSFGMILGTRDGGKTWTSWMEQVDNERLLHLTALQEIAGQLYIASEKGTVFRLDRQKQRFVELKTGYVGSFFGIVGLPGVLLAHGLRGTVYRSLDEGGTWQKVETGVNAGITAGSVTDGGRILLATQDGRLLVSDDRGASFKSVKVSAPTLFAGVTQSGQNAVMVGLGGVRIVPLPPP